MDFMSDRVFDGRPFRILTVVDCHTREALSLTPRANVRAFQVTEALDALVRLRGRPKSLRVDNGPEFAGRMLDQWAYLNGVEIDFSRPGKPTDNAYNRVVQRPSPSGVPERLVVPVAGRCPRAHRGLEVPRQRRSTPHGPGRLDAPSLRQPSCHCPRTCIGRGPQTGSTSQAQKPYQRADHFSGGRPPPFSGAFSKPSSKCRQARAAASSSSIAAGQAMRSSTASGKSRTRASRSYTGSPAARRS